MNREETISFLSDENKTSGDEDETGADEIRDFERKKIKESCKILIENLLQWWTNPIHCTGLFYCSWSDPDVQC